MVETTLGEKQEAVLSSKLEIKGLLRSISASGLYDSLAEEPRLHQTITQHKQWCVTKSIRSNKCLDKGTLQIFIVSSKVYIRTSKNR